MRSVRLQAETALFSGPRAGSRRRGCLEVVFRVGSFSLSISISESTRSVFVVQKVPLPFLDDSEVSAFSSSTKSGRPSSRLIWPFRWVRGCRRRRAFRRRRRWGCTHPGGLSGHSAERASRVLSWCRPFLRRPGPGFFFPDRRGVGAAGGIVEGTDWHGNSSFCVVGTPRML